MFQIISDKFAISWISIQQKLVADRKITVEIHPDVKGVVQIKEEEADRTIQFSTFFQPFCRFSFATA